MSARTLSKLGLAGIAAAVLGVLSAGLMLVWTPQVAPGVVRYPFTTAGFRTIQTWFFVHHLLLVAVAVGFARSSALGAGRWPRVAAWTAVVGLAGLAAMELFAIRFANWDLRAANEGVMGAGYGITTNLVGLGMLVAGVRAFRARSWPGALRVVPLAIGITHFTLVTPAIFSNGYVVARLAIGSWIALFAPLGWALVLESRSRSGAQTVAR